MEPQLDEELAWEPGWTCPACTLANESDAARCVACDSLRASVRNSGVVVVLPPERKPKRDADSDQWACPACTLLNGDLEDRCGACGSQRWVSKRPKTAAALRAARRDLSRNVKASTLASEEHGIWGGLGPDREFLPLPPAPEGRIVHRSAKDTDVDIFAELGESPVQTSEAPEPVAPVAPCPAPDTEPEKRGSGPEARPAWRVQGAPLFAGETSLESLELGLSEAAVFEDALGRLALSGFEITKCHLALEAAGGDENLARQFLLCPE